MSRLQDLDFRQGIEIPDNGRSIRGRLGADLPALEHQQKTGATPWSTPA